MLQLRQLKIFLAAAESLSFTAASKRVHLSQPSVTEQIQALEQAVGQQLFVRSNNRLTLTPAGERLASRARDLLAMAEDTLKSVRNESIGQTRSIRVAAPQSLCTSLLIPLLADYAGLRPETQIVVQERHSEATTQAVQDGTADLGLIHGWPADNTRLRISVVTRDEPVVVLPAGHPLQETETVSPEELSRFPLLATEQGCRYRGYLDLLLQEAPVRPRISGVSESVPALVEMVSRGMGISVLPRMAVTASAGRARIELRALSTTREGLPICLLTPDRDPLDHLAEFIQMIRLVMSGSDQPVPALDMQHGAGRIAVA